MRNIFTLLTADTVLLTPNRRLSANLLGAYHQQQVLASKLCWLTPSILPFNAWLQQMWLQYTSNHITPQPLLLNKLQEYLLWEDILTENRAADYLLQVAQTAETAHSAWNLLRQWEINPDDSAFQSSEDYRAFQSWAKQFTALCQQNYWLDQAGLMNFVLEQLANKKLSAPGHLLLAGFTELSPQQETLLRQCEQLGTRVTHYQPTQSATHIKRISLHDTTSEIRSMALWAKGLIETSTNPIMIGCVVPQLEQHRDEVSRIFSEVFAEPNQFSIDPDQQPFNISAGKPLNSYPIVHAAFELLKLATGAISLETFSYILRSPYLAAGEKEMLARAQYENFLRQKNVSTITLAKLLSQEKLGLKSNCPLLAKKLNQFYSLTKQFTATATLHQWGEQFLQLLNIMGWPGERSLDSHEYQVVQAWLNCLADYMTLDTLLSAKNFSNALYNLQQLTRRTIYQPQSPEAPIHILGILEAVALPFDYLWVMGMDDQAWPPTPKANAFIPKQLQKNLQLPHATAEREYTYCKKLTEQLKQTAPSIIFSHAAQKEEMELNCSPLLEDLPQQSLLELELANYTPAAKKIYHQRNIEWLHDEQAPAITATEKIRGGVSILKYQAACPFKAFAELRLHIKNIDELTPGLKAPERGSIIHKALELIWNELNDYSGLLRLTEEELNQLVRRHVDAAIALVTQQTDQTRYLSLESLRVQKLIKDWLQLEKARKPFKVLAHEQAQTIQLGNIPFSLRVDRIDELADGSLLIIDYKTGKNQGVKDWFGERPDEPQLPLYCLTHSPTAIAFGQICAGELTFKGISKTELDIKNITTLAESRATTAVVWEQQLIDWRIALTKLSDDFYQGHAIVDPRDAETCRLCHLSPICRIQEENDNPDAVH